MTADELIAHAARLQAGGDFAGAERACRGVLAHEPDHPQALHFLGLLCHRSGRSAEALGLLRRSVAIAPQREEFPCNLAAVLGATGRLTEALACLDGAVSLHPEHALT